MSRSAALGRALLFLALTSPIWAFNWANAAFNPLGVLALVLAATLGFLWWDKRSPAALGLDPRPRRLAELGLGAIGGMLLVGVIAVVLYFALPFPWRRNPGFSAGQALMSLVSLLVLGGIEELVFRGYSFERLISAIGHWPAQIGTALVFAVFHVLHGWTWGTALIGTTLGSILFGLVFVRWKSVPAALGVHAAANWTRNLVLDDPPTARTLFGPVADRHWVPLEVFTSRVVWNAGAFIACVVLAIVVFRHGRAAQRAAVAP